MIIAFEGLDAAGKATQSRLLFDRLRREGRDVAIFSFPRYDTPVGTALKEVLTAKDINLGDSAVAHTIQSLMTVDKIDAYREMRFSGLDGRIVICDRWTPSALCYGQADGLSRAWLDSIQRSLPEADVCFLLDLPTEQAFRRRPDMRDRYERDRLKQGVIRANYHALWAEKGWDVIDGSGTEDEVAARVWKILDERGVA